MATMQSIFDEVYQYVNDCPRGLLESETRKAVRDFCKGTFAWEVQLPAKRIVKDVRKYPLVSDIEDTEIIRMVEARRKTCGFLCL